MIQYDFETVFIMLGSKCNLNCTYCLQKTKNNKLQENIEISPKLINFLKNKKNIHFFGGEPLLYFEQIKYIVNNVGESFYTIITNGTLLNDDMINFFNDHKFKITISFDGFNSSAGKQKINYDLIEKINNLRLYAVLSNNSSFTDIINSFSETDSKYFNKNQRHIDMIICPVYDTGIQNKHVFDVNYEKSFDEIKSYAKQYIYLKNQKCIKQTNRNYTIISIFDKILSQIKEALNSKENPCSPDKFINVGLNGDVYLCHNIFHKICTIDVSYENYIKLSNENIKNDFSNCKNCEIKKICKGGCKMFKTNPAFCKYRKLLLTPLIEAIMESKNG